MNFCTFMEGEASASRFAVRKGDRTPQSVPQILVQGPVPFRTLRCTMNEPHVLEQLAQRIREIEASARPHQHTTIPLGVPGLDKILPEGRLPAGALVELLQTAEGAGAWTVALVLARQACGDDKVLLVADPQRCLYPPAATKLGIDLERTIVVRPKAPASALIAAVQGLRCAAIGAVVG